LVSFERLHGSALLWCCCLDCVQHCCLSVPYVTSQHLTPSPLRHISLHQPGPLPLRVWRHLWTSPYPSVNYASALQPRRPPKFRVHSSSPYKYDGPSHLAIMTLIRDTFSTVCLNIAWCRSSRIHLAAVGPAGRARSRKVSYVARREAEVLARTWREWRVSANLLARCCHAIRQRQSAHHQDSVSWPGAANYIE